MNIAVEQSGRWVFFAYDCTTDSGLYDRHVPLNALGSAVLVPCQYSGAFLLGQHQGKYEAFAQAKVLPVFRDDDRDGDIDVSDTINSG